METTGSKTTATLLQLSAYTQYFFPLGNFIFPVIIWSAKKQESEFVNYNGKQAINFQLSLLMYTILLVVIAVPTFLFAFFNGLDVTGMNTSEWEIENFNFARVSTLMLIGIIACVTIVVMKVLEFFLILYAAVKNTNGENFNYPLTIKFLR
jgi:uncharacterized Tic20 family protein